MPLVILFLVVLIGLKYFGIILLGWLAIILIAIGVPFSIFAIWFMVLGIYGLAFARTLARGLNF